MYLHQTVLLKTNTFFLNGGPLTSTSCIIECSFSLLLVDWHCAPIVHSRDRISVFPVQFRLAKEFSVRPGYTYRIFTCMNFIKNERFLCMVKSCFFFKKQSYLSFSLLKKHQLVFVLDTIPWWWSHKINCRPVWASWQCCLWSRVLSSLLLSAVLHLTSSTYSPSNFWLEFFFSSGNPKMAWMKEQERLDA